MLPLLLLYLKVPIHLVHQLVQSLALRLQLADGFGLFGELVRLLGVAFALIAFPLLGGRQCDNGVLFDVFQLSAGEGNGLL